MGTVGQWSISNQPQVVPQPVGRVLDILGTQICKRTGPPACFLTFYSLLPPSPYVQVVVSGMSVGEMALHFLEKYGIMVLRLASKFELMRLCKATGAAARSTFGAPSPDEIGFVNELVVQVGII